MVTTDLHYIDPVYFEGSDRLARSAAYGDGKMPHHSEAWLRALVLETIAQAPDALVLLGDLSYNGEVLSHKAISLAMAEVEANGIPVLVIPGNHDLNNDYAFTFLADHEEPTHSLPPARYAKYYGDLGHDLAFSRDTASFSYAVRLPDVWLLLLDAGIYEPVAESFGLIPAETEAWLSDVLAQAAEAGAQVITASHQGLLPHGGQSASKYLIVNGPDIAARLRASGVRLHLSGHIHVQHIAEADGLYDIALSAFSCYPHQYGLATIEADGSIAYATQSVQASHLPEGLYAQSHDFFLRVNEQKVLSALEDSAADARARASMAAYAATLNLHYYAGTVSSVRKAALADEALALWRQYGEGSFWADYLERMLGDTARSMHTLSLPAKAP